MRVAAVTLAALCCWAPSASAAAAGDFPVTTTADVNHGSCMPMLCTLRDAITAANAVGPSATNTITLPAGTYTIDNSLADLPAISRSTTINGAGAFSSFIDGGMGSTIHHALTVADAGTAVTVNLNNLTLQRVVHANDGTLSVSFSKSGSMLNVSNSIVRQNTADVGSAGIESVMTGRGTVNISDTTIAGNHDATLGALAISGGASVTVARSTIAGNTGGQGAAICIHCSGTIGTPMADLVNSTISGNTGPGSIIDDENSPAITTFSYDTISGNGGGSAVLMRSATSGQKFKGNIIAGNRSTNCIYTGTAPVSLGFNFDDGATCGFTDPTTDHQNTAVALGSRGKNGGPTATQALIGPAGVDAGGPSGACRDVNDTVLTTDQRGLVRPQGASCDAGAVEKWAATANADPATAVGATGATLEGSLNPNVVATSYHFNYGTTASYGSFTPGQDAGSGSSPVAASAAISGLTPSTLYHFQLVATSDFGTVASGDMTFTTAANPPPPVATPAPRCSLTPVSSRVTMHGHRKGRKRITTATLSLKARCDQSVNARASGSVTEVLAGKHKHRKAPMKKFNLDSVTASLNGRAAKVLVLKLPAAALAALSNGRKESASLALTARNANGRGGATAKIAVLRL